MADLGGRDRGQIILIAAFALAVIFVSLALVVNSAIFTENLASRGDTTGSGEALSERAAVEANVGNAIEAVNRDNPVDLDGAVKENITAYQSQSGPQQASSGQVTNVSYENSVEGDRITYTAGGTFNGPGSQYDLVDGVDRVTNGEGTRAFVIDATSLPDGSASQPPFNISVIDNNYARWTAEIYEDTSSGEVVIQTTRVDSAGNVVTDECRIAAGSSSAPLIDLTEGTVNGRPCDALGTTDDADGDNLNFGAGTNDPYRIRFEDTDNIAGSYSLVVHGADSFDTDGTVSDALYQVTVEYSYSTTKLQYTTDIRVAPGEPDA